MRRLLAVALLALAIQGCCSCDDRPERGPQRPGDVVRALRDAIADHRWNAAAECFSRELAAQNELAMRSGSFFTHTSILGSVPISGPWPLDVRDVVIDVDVQGESATVSLESANILGPERPRKLILAKGPDGLWKITDWDPRT